MKFWRQICFRYGTFSIIFCHRYAKFLYVVTFCQFSETKLKMGHEHLLDGDRDTCWEISIYERAQVVVNVTTTEYQGTEQILVIAILENGETCEQINMLSAPADDEGCEIHKLCKQLHGSDDGKTCQFDCECGFDNCGMTLLTFDEQQISVCEISAGM